MSPIPIYWPDTASKRNRLLGRASEVVPAGVLCRYRRVAREKTRVEIPSIRSGQGGERIVACVLDSWVCLTRPRDADADVMPGFLGLIYWGGWLG